MAQPLPMIRLERATIARPGNHAAFRDLNWTIHDGETWAIVGPVGSGKSTLAEALAGRLHADGIDWPFIDRLRAAGRVIDWPSEVIQRVAFKEESRQFSYSRHYYQQRFNFIERDDDLTLDAFLRANTSVDEPTIQRVAERLDVAHLRDLSLIKLSNGQTRRARIARALIAKPEMLILDDPFMGLDAGSRAKLTGILGGLIQDGLRVVLICRPDAVPDWVRHVVELERMTVRRQVARRDFAIVEQCRESVWSPPPRQQDASPSAARPIVEMRNVRVEYEGRSILQDITWTIREGERWALLGPNGSGKTTLLSLIAADHPRAYSNDIVLFGQKRGSGESIWDIKRQIGLVSPEMHLYFSEPLSARRAAATGFFDVLTDRPTSREQDRTLNELLEYFELTALAERRFASLSTGEQRLVLLVRALVKSPPLLILDEPFQGLDDRLVNRLRDWLNEQLKPEQSLIFVSHRPEEIPGSVDRALHLQGGRMADIC